VGCIDTEKPPFKTFWTFADATLEAHGALFRAGNTADAMTDEQRAVGNVAIVASAIRTYITGMRIYHAARYAYSKPVKQDRLGAYWDRVKIF
jgi:hypothetical protein